MITLDLFQINVLDSLEIGTWKSSFGILRLVVSLDRVTWIADWMAWLGLFL